jgi:urease subunit gamma/beta
VRLTRWEEERLLIFSAAELARRHRAAGISLNSPEAVALMCDAMLEAARADRSYAEVEAAGYAAIAPAEVLAGVRELIDDVRIEVLFGDGPRLVVLLDPLGRGAPASPHGPGAVVVGDPAGDDGAAWMVTAERLERIEVSVESTSRRTVRISSHYPFDQVNPRLIFDRDRTRGFHLDIPAGSSERWGPGESRTVRLVRYGSNAGAGT